VTKTVPRKSPLRRTPGPQRAADRTPRGPGTLRRRLRTVGALVLLLIVAGLLPGAARLVDFGARVADGALLEADVASFYTAPTPASAAVPASTPPGTIVRREPVAAAPDGTVAWRILYHSTDVDGADSIVSGLVVAPSAPVIGAARTIVSWGHPTTGTAPRCAPSRGIAPFVLIEGLAELVAAGNIVVATDYSGMGVAGPPSFLIGATEAANMLDIARAARTIDRIGAGNRVVLWGHSQGGQAALFAAQRAAAYAPELAVAGVAVAAPATDLGALLRADEDDVSGVTIGAYAFDSYAAAYRTRLPDDPLARILSPAGAAA
jgi:fermentation-respiration switch protein FrsA (DUF1100 family)